MSDRYQDDEDDEDIHDMSSSWSSRRHDLTLDSTIHFSENEISTKNEYFYDMNDYYVNEVPSSDSRIIETSSNSNNNVNEYISDSADVKTDESIQFDHSDIIMESIDVSIHVTDFDKYVNKFIYNETDEVFLILNDVTSIQGNICVDRLKYDYITIIALVCLYLAFYVFKMILPRFKNIKDDMSIDENSRGLVLLNNRDIDISTEQLINTLQIEEFTVGTFFDCVSKIECYQKIIERFLTILELEPDIATKYEYSKLCDKYYQQINSIKDISNYLILKKKQSQVKELRNVFHEIFFRIDSTSFECLHVSIVLITYSHTLDLVLVCFQLTLMLLSRLKIE